MLADTNLMKAVSRINQRSERQTDAEKIIDTYVDIGLLPQLENRNHQVFYGRRGTGKTHVIKVLADALQQEDGSAVVYIDCRTLGSSNQFSDFSLPMPGRCLALFKDLLLAIQDGLIEYIAEHPTARQESAFEALAEFGQAVAEPTRRASSLTITEQRLVSSGSSVGASVGSVVAAAPSIVFGATSAAASSETQSETVARTEVIEEKILFPDLTSTLNQVLEIAGAHLYVLIDEWSSLPVDIQPYLSEFIRRGLVPLERVTLKISALEYRCRFTKTYDHGVIGFELGADVATAPDLDDYYVFDRNPAHLTDVYADMLLRHISSELPENYLLDTHRIGDARQLASRMFTESAVFAELARASEGVVRDLINIFTRAYFNAHRRGRDSIDKRAVLEAARQWFEQDKSQQLDEHLQQMLSKIVHEVIGARRSRSFMLPREMERHPTIQRLFDARVIHHMQRGYADKDNPGLRYNIYTVDYGTYVDLIGTARQPDVQLRSSEDVENDDEVIVPFDDKRSIRRIILDGSILT